ncbi:MULTISPECIES: ArsC family reductase [Marinomonas]|uniref:ArsC family reductase n=1 Tax=Marinomonas arctica TaxID=383750 RepID=A0A7H1J958_9GAMM|nr:MULTISPECIES: ArsC family reductase [Marinomonas]MCS7487309.1 ArsC family transcriptional regulator [Marinomonas sp. BSi20414]QNT07024.1 ArsC family reductase [Marinomonas arctica]
MIQIFGIKNCDTMKKAFRWLDENNIEYAFHDYKKAGLDEETAKAWIDTMGWENIINKRGTTWRKLDEEIKSSMNNDNAMHLMVTQPSIIKRPLVITKGSIHLGFSPEEYASLFLA